MKGASGGDIRSLARALREAGDPERAKHSLRFFKTGPGEYGENDRFVGVTVPVIRKFARQYRNLPPEETETLLASPVHEERLCALIILTERYKRGDEKEREAIFRLYRRNLRHVNNWDLVDVSAEHIVGARLFGGDTSLLFRLARSRDLWERRVAVLSTFHFIRRGEFKTMLEIAEMLLEDGEDLIHKAVGWMLREIGKRDPHAEREFLDRHASRMPRTMLRYAIEKFDEPLRKSYLRKRGSPLNPPGS